MPQQGIPGGKSCGNTKELYWYFSILSTEYAKLYHLSTQFFTPLLPTTQSL